MAPPGTAVRRALARDQRRPRAATAAPGGAIARRRRFSAEPFGPTIERLMTETGVTYRGLAEATGLSAGYLNHLVHGNRPVPSDDVMETLARSLGVGPEHFREYRLRVVAQRLETKPDLIDRLYKRLT